jgi:signal transduction histidine kinase/CheY-like chemotaxis protein/HPt (histidine-containing phosphotransfer) domain-containing protein
MLLTSIFTGCRRSGENRSGEPVRFTCFREVPGLTADDIKAVEELLAQRESFSYAMLYSTSAFIDVNSGNSEIRGYSALMCEWLTELFGVPFILEHTAWNELLEGLENGSIDFTGTMTPSEERRLTYFMTDPISRRSIRYFRLEGSEPIEEIIKERLPRYALLERAISAENILTYKIYDFEPVFIPEYIDAYDLLIAGEIDALLAENTAEAVFDRFNNVVSAPFFPLLYTPVSLTAQNPEFEPIINVVQKILENGGKHFLDELFDEGHREYLRHKFFLRLTDEEINYIKNNPVIPFGAENGNYPISFYNEHHKEWQGIAFDVLTEIEELTGFEFSVFNDKHTPFPELLEMLQDGRVYVVSEVIRTQAREDAYIWTDNAFMTDRSVIISKSTLPNISTNQVSSLKIGLSRGSAHTEYFFTWFPNHQNYIIYESQQQTFDALMSGEVDLIINSNSTLLDLINYQELPDYKANIIFNNSFDSTYGINKEQVLLRSIIDKALEIIDTEHISELWRNRTYDYRLKLMQAQRPWIIGFSFLLLCVLILVAVLLTKSRRESQKLVKLIEERTSQLELVNQYKSSFLANMSHEIRTPMNSILGITEMLIQNEGLPKEVEIGLSKTYSSCDMLLGIINDILDFSKIEAGKLDITPAVYSVASLVNDAAQLNTMRIESKPIEFILNIDENVPAKLIGDELRIKQILNNLLSNAFKYTDSGTVTMTLNFKPLPEDNMIMLEFVVKDSGRGMTPEQVEKLFDEYSRFEKGTHSRIEGTGLGLAITQRLTRLMNGEINVNSVYGVGSWFTVSFPQEIADKAVLGKEVADNLRFFRMNNLAHSKICQITRDLMPYGNVLVVDDVETNLYVAVGLMKPYELTIDTVSSGYEAIKKVADGKKYDIIFMDHMMPGMDGVEATAQLRESGYSEPIVALSANAVSGQAEIFLENGFDGFISKPVDVRQLNLILNKFVRDKQPPGVIDAARHQKRKEESYDALLKEDRVLLDSFIKDARKAINVIGELYNKNEFKSNEDDLRRLVTFAHGIKSSLWNIGEKKLSETAAKLEAEGRAKNIDYIETVVPGFLSKLSLLTEGLESACGSECAAAEDANSETGASVFKIKDRKADGLDIEKGVEKYSGDEDIYLSILRSYTASTSSMLDVIENFDEEKLREYEIKVHGIKGASRDMFAEEIGEAAAKLEIAAKAGDIDYIRENNPAFIISAREFIQSLEALLSEIDTANPKLKLIKPDRVLLSKLLEACKIYDMSAADEAMTELRKYKYDNDNELVEWLGDKCDMTKFSDIVEKLSAEFGE